MSKDKEKVAALLINRYFVQKKALDIGRIKSVSSRKKSSDPSAFDWSNQALVENTKAAYAKLNGKEHIENLKHTISTLVSGNPLLSVTWAPKIGLRGLDGSIVCKGIKYSDADLVYRSLSSSRQNPAFLSAIANSPYLNVMPGDEGGVTIKLLNYASKPYIDLSGEYDACIAQISPSINLCETIAHIWSTCSEPEKEEIIRGRAVAIVNIEDSPKFKITGISIEETDAARAQRLQREALEALKRRRTAQIQQIVENNSTLSYTLSGIEAPEETAEVSIRLENLTGEW